MELAPADWLDVLGAQTPPTELIARGTVMYLGVLVFMRVMPRRAGGDLSRMDLVFILLVAEAAAHSLGGYETVADGLIVIATLMVWDYVINSLSYRIPFVERLVSARPVQIVRGGKLVRRNLRQEFLTEEELMSHLRREGIDDIKDVKAAFVESEGTISVVPMK